MAANRYAFEAVTMTVRRDYERHIITLTGADAWPAAGEIIRTAAENFARCSTITREGPDGAWTRMVLALGGGRTTRDALRDTWDDVRRACPSAPALAGVGAERIEMDDVETGERFDKSRLGLAERYGFDRGDGVRRAGR
jgi:hypothetical protein